MQKTFQQLTMEKVNLPFVKEGSSPVRIQSNANSLNPVYFTRLSRTNRKNFSTGPSKWGEEQSLNFSPTLGRLAVKQHLKEPSFNQMSQSAQR